VTTLDGQLFLLGGFKEDTAQNSCFEMDFNTLKLVEKEPLITARYLFATVYDHKNRAIYALCGCTDEMG